MGLTEVSVARSNVLVARGMDNVRFEILVGVGRDCGVNHSCIRELIVVKGLVSACWLMGTAVVLTVVHFKFQIKI